MVQEKKRCVVLGVTGSIAAYKAAEIASALKKQDVDVYAVMTRAATEFLQPLTLESLTGHPVAVDLFARETPWEIEHISLAKRADLFLIAPATANLIGKLANGIADDMLSTTLMACRVPILLAPAMNAAMYESAANTANLETLKRRGVHFCEPARGILACGDEGIGKLASVETIVRRAMRLLSGTPQKQDFAGKSLLVSAGPTREALDPVRFLSNRSSGKMGYAIAEAARDRGAEVTLVSGPVALAPPDGVHLVPIQSTEDLFESMRAAFSRCDVCVMAAAPADFTPVSFAENKIKKQDNSGDVAFAFRRTPDVLAALGEVKTGAQFLCGFAAETQNLDDYAKGKLARKHLDMIVANDVSKAQVGFDHDTNEVSVYLADGSFVALPLASKRAIADALLDIIAKNIA